MRHVFSGLLFVLLLIARPAAMAEDLRTAIDLTPDVKAQLLDEMRGHMDALDDVMAAVASGDFKRAAQEARMQLGVGSGKGLGRFMPVEFRQMGMGMHRSALDFADVAAAAPSPASAGDWQRVVGAMQSISLNCRACHSAFRIK